MHPSPTPTSLQYCACASYHGTQSSGKQTVFLIHVRPSAVVLAIHTCLNAAYDSRAVVPLHWADEEKKRRVCRTSAPESYSRLLRRERHPQHCKRHGLRVFVYKHVLTNPSELNKGCIPLRKCYIPLHSLTPLLSLLLLH